MSSPFRKAEKRAVKLRAAIEALAADDSLKEN